VQEVTRLGMKEREMRQIAKFMRRVIVDKEKPERISNEVKEFRRDYLKICYCFDNYAVKKMDYGWRKF
jgi:glycine hydroxymethyltransferase